MDVLFIIPPYAIGADGQAVIPSKAMLPNGALIMAQRISDGGRASVCVVDLVFTPDWQAELTDKLGRPDVVLLSCHTLRNVTTCRQVLNLVRQHCQPHVVLGGNACADLSIADFEELGLVVDAVCRGYAHDLVEDILAREQGDLYISIVKPDMPPPEPDILGQSAHEAYLRASSGRYPMYGHGFGCRWTCSYCSSRNNSGWMPRIWSMITQEVLRAKMLGYRHIWCVDNLVLVEPEVTRQFDQLITAVGMTWSGMDRVEQVLKYRDTLPRLQSLTNLAMGVESVDTSTLRVLGRGVGRQYLENARRAFAAAREAGIFTTAFVMLDLPTDSETSFWNLYRFLQEIRPDTVSWSFYNPPPREGDPNTAGFYRWPLGFSTVPPERVVQQAMVLTGVWWMGFTLCEERPFFANQSSFGVRFVEGSIYQNLTESSPIGDLWEIWKHGEEDRR